MTAESTFRWRSLGLAFRLGLSFLVLILLGGLLVSARYMSEHYENRDGDAELSLDDVRAAYHGVYKPAAMLVALESGHPSDEAPDALMADGRETLLAWLRSDRLSEDYDSLDLGDAAPAEIIGASCLGCHSRGSDHESGIGQRRPLEDWEDVRSAAFSKEVEPTSPSIVLASLHTHSIALGTLAVVAALLLAGSRLPRRLMGLLVLGAGFGLALDLASWFLARGDDIYVWGIVVGGFLFAASTGLSLLAVLIDLWMPSCSDGSTCTP